MGVGGISRQCGEGGGVTRPIMVSMCDKSGVMAQPWSEAGIDCYCVDIQHSIRRERVEGRIHYAWGDVRSWTPHNGTPHRPRYGILWARVEASEIYQRKQHPMTNPALILRRPCHECERMFDLRSDGTYSASAKRCCRDSAEWHARMRAKGMIRTRIDATNTSESEAI